MTEWYEDERNQLYIEHLRANIADSGRVLVFLGAGLSFGAARLGSRSRFDSDRSYPWYGYPYKPPRKGDGDYRDIRYPFGWDDDNQPLPSWYWLICRMRRRLALYTSEAEQPSLDAFFLDQGPLDCAQLFRQTIGDANYRDFLAEQFDIGRYPHIRTTPSHVALVALNLPLIFTTNYDELIEAAHREAGIALRVSVDDDEFKAHRLERPAHHLVKLHGSIHRPDSIVLTRADYSRARAARREMLGVLRHELAQMSFLFVGFSLNDPNFSLIRDDIRDSLGGMNMPVSYTVQGRRDPVKERYLTSLDVNTIWLDTWNSMPDFLTRISPARVSSRDIGPSESR